jgi:hypothetical protein
MKGPDSFFYGFLVRNLRLRQLRKLRLDLVLREVARQLLEFGRP